MKVETPFSTQPVGRTTHDYLMEWLKENRSERLLELRRAAHEVRVQFFGAAARLWGTVKISNHCDDVCGFCGLRSGNHELPRYRMTTEQVLQSARQAADSRCQTLVLQSGRDPQLSTDWLRELIGRIRGETGLAVALSLGECSETEAAAWRNAGAEYYLLRFMTCHTTLYRLLHDAECKDSRRRLPLLATLKDLGYQVGSGLLVGFPGQSHAGLADDLELIRKLDLNVVLIGPYIWPASLGQWHLQPSTGEPNSASAVLTVLALARQLCPEAEIPSTSALATVGGMDVHQEALHGGANVMMLEFTPAKLSGHYRSYPHRAALEGSDLHKGSARLRTILGIDGAEDKSAGKIEANVADGDIPVEPPLRIGFCMGSSCFSRGNNRSVAMIKDFIRREHLEGRVILEGHHCEGQCKDGPNAVIGAEHRQHADPAAVLELLRKRFKLKE
jgi:biotin synthase